jgi:hypothetical protein
MRFKVAKISDGSREAAAFRKMPRGVSVSLHSILFQ